MRALVLLLALLASGSAVAGAQRIVTLAPHLAELVCAAGGCDYLVGVVRYTDFPENAARLPQVGDAATVNVEALLALKPDLVLAWDGGTPPDTIVRLRGLGLRVEAVRVRTLREIGDALWQVGTLMQTQTAAALAVKLYHHRLDQLQVRYWQKPRLTVMYQIETGPIYTVNSLSPIHEALSLCGGQNVFSDLPRIASTVSVEAVLAANPQAVFYSRQDNAVAIREQWARFPQTRAQHVGAIYAVDGNLLEHQSPRMLDGIAQLCEALDDARAKYARASAASSSGAATSPTK
ncbi:MAG TPA: cobalamin-binding protein [Nevskiaceae bacterium]|nr:cobalamin-binding protein [Nevskiaceae bacterium]